MFDLLDDIDAYIDIDIQQIKQKLVLDKNYNQPNICLSQSNIDIDIDNIIDIQPSSPKQLYARPIGWYWINLDDSSSIYSYECDIVIEIGTW